MLGIIDRQGKSKLVYSPPVAHFASDKTIALPLEFDEATSNISFTLPELTYPIIIAFALGVKLPDAKGGFNFGFAFPKFKFGAKGEVEEESRVSDESDGYEEGNVNVEVDGALGAVQASSPDADVDANVSINVEADEASSSSRFKVC